MLFFKNCMFLLAPHHIVFLVSCVCFFPEENKPWVRFPGTQHGPRPDFCAEPDQRITGNKGSWWERKGAKQICVLRIPDCSLMTYNMHHFKHVFCIFLKGIFGGEDCSCCPRLPAALDLGQCSGSFRIPWERVFPARKSCRWRGRQQAEAKRSAGLAAPRAALPQGSLAFNPLLAP